MLKFTFQEPTKYPKQVFHVRFEAQNSPEEFRWASDDPFKA